MESVTVTAREGRVLAAQSGAAESAVSAVSWPAMIAGAFAMAAASLILLALGSGLGLSSISPWYNSGPSATTFGVWAAVWLIVVQWLSAALGGYLTGRLRTKWVGIHTDEVYFRDTAHGFLAWTVAAVIMAAALSSVVSSAVGSVARATGSLASAAAQGVGTTAAQSGGVDPTGYLIDTLFRSDHPDTNASSEEVRTEATRIIVSGLRNGDVPAADKAYLSQLVAARTGISQADAQKRGSMMRLRRQRTPRSKYARSPIRHARRQRRLRFLPPFRCWSVRLSRLWP